jgi:hypothetical protein
VSDIEPDPLLEYFREDYIAGKRLALMEAVRQCAQTKVPLPNWAAEAFVECFEKVMGYQVPSWDAVFGNPLPQGMRRETARLIKEKAPQIVLCVDYEHYKNGRAIDDRLFEEVGKKFGIGKTLCKKLYYFGADPRPRGRRKKPRN